MFSDKRHIFQIISGTSVYCCICLNNVAEGNSFFSMEDEVAINNANIYKITDIMAFVLGFDYLQDVPTKIVCGGCLESSLKCFSFIIKCKENTKHFCQLIGSLNSWLDSAMDTLDNHKSVFVTVDNKLCVLSFYFDEKFVSDNKVEALKRLQEPLDQRSEKSKEELLDNFIFDDPGFETKANIKKRKKLIIRSKIPISQMLDGGEHSALFKCKECHKEYTTMYNLKRHYVRMHAPKTMKCNECKRTFGSQAILNEHKYESHACVMCTECGKTYTNRKTLALHELSHKLRIACTTCNKVFCRKKNYRMHILSKTCGQQQRNKTKNMYICDYCSKTYACKPTLRVHIQFEHCGGQQHICTWCSKKFSALSKLKAHCLTHTQEKNFSCDICGGKFVSKESLLYHTRIHTGDKPFQCDHCDQRFLSSSRRAEHIRRHHTEPQLECDICRHKFKTRSCLMRHKKRHYDPTSRLHYTRVTQNEDL